VNDLKAVWDGITYLYDKAVEVWNDIVGLFENAIKSIVGAVQGLWNTLTGASIWTDMLGEMDDQTKTTMKSIVGTFQDGFAKIPTAVPRPSMASPIGGPGGVGGALGGASSVSLPVSVYVDSKLISTIVNQRMIEDQRNRGAGR
jgi:hypothetical protein